MPLIEITSELDCPLPTPVRVPVPTGARLPAGAFQAREEGGARTSPVQRDGNDLVLLVSGLAAGKRYRFRTAEGGPAMGVTLKETGPSTLSIDLPEGTFTVYNFDPQGVRPYFYPVHGPGGKRMTRDFPMKDVPEEKAAKDQDHPHHRSFWTALDEVSGVDNWSEIQGKHGYTKHKAFQSRSQGPVFGGFTATATWTSHEGKPVLDEWRGIRVYNAGPDQRLLDYEVHLTAAYQDVEYGDTKEGGILAFRVFHTMKEAEGGVMENSVGGRKEAEVWGKHAAWLDYSGPIEGEVLGIAMMDHPGNPYHPCRWHARAYGLVGTNPFSTAAFEKGAAETIRQQKQGETLRFRYRVLMHKGNAKQGAVDQAYHAWIQAPVGKIEG